MRKEPLDRGAIAFGSYVAKEIHVSRKSLSWKKPVVRLALPLLAGTLGLTSPVQAQLSDGYKFLEAVRKKEGAKVEEVLNQPGSTLVNARDISNGRSALHIVAARRDLTWLRYLTSKGADVNVRDNRGESPLQLATSLGWIDGVQHLVASGARLDESNDAGETPLISAVHRKNVALMRILLEGGADPDRADNSGRTARDYALLNGKNSPLVAAIETHAEPRSEREAQAVYGPVF